MLQTDNLKPAPEKICVVSICSDSMKRYGEISSAAASAYCAKHGYRFIVYKELLLSGIPPAWSKLQAILDAFQDGAEWVLWLDADAIILNPEIKLEKYISEGADMVLTAGFSGLDAGVIFAKNCSLSRKFIEGALTLSEEYTATNSDEKDALQDLFAANELVRSRFNILAPRAMCSYIEKYDFNDFILHLRCMGHLARYQYLKTMYSAVYGKNKEFKTAMHGGDIGDVIYSVPLLKKLGIKRVILNPESPYKTKMNAAACAALAPLLQRQGYIVEIGGETFDADTDYYIDIFRECPSDMENNHLSLTNSEKILPGLDISQKYLEAESKYIADVVISRSARYRNPDFDWLYLLADLPDSTKIAFVGLKSEYDLFCRHTNLGKKVFFYPTQDLNAVAEVIAGAAVFIGNQSAPYAIAEGLKVNRVQETCLYTPNCKAQSDNGIDVKSRRDLYGAKVKIKEWLGTEFSVSAPPKKVLLYTTCYISNEYQYKRVCNWLDYYLPLLEKLGVSNVTLMDDCSPRDWLARLREKYQDMAVLGIRPIEEKGKSGYEIPMGANNSRLSLVTFPERLGRPHEGLFPGWWRSYSFGVVLAEVFNFEKFIFLETDTYLYADKLYNWLYNTNSGFNSLYSRASDSREVAVQVCARSEFHRITKFFKTRFLNDKFWWGVGLTAAQYLPEHTLPFTNDLECVKEFRIDRYGDDAFSEIPEDAEGCCNLTDISLDHKYHKNERLKNYQHSMIMERKDEPALSGRRNIREF